MNKRIPWSSLVLVGLLLIAILCVIPVRAPLTSIAIRSDADFALCGCVSGGTGSTQASPYVLSGLTLYSVSAPGLLVDNTKGKITKFFNVVGDTITGGSGPPTNYPGVEFINVNGLGEITGSVNTFNGNQYGILLKGSSHILVDGVSSSNGATVNSNGITGIAVVGGGYNTITNVQVNHNGIGIPEGFLGGGTGISLNHTTANTVRSLTLSEDSFAGFALFGSSNNIVDSVSIHYPDFYGAVVDGGSGNTIENSVFQTADYVGLWLRDSASGSLVVGNAIYANGPTGDEIKAAIVPYFIAGLYISSGATNNRIQMNDFNANSGGSIILDNGHIVNGVQSPIQSNNPFNDPLTGNEPKKTIPPSGLAGSGNTFCGNAIVSSQGVPSNPACT